MSTVNDSFRGMKVDRLTTKHIDHHGRRITNAGDAIDPQDYVTKRQLDSLSNSIVSPPPSGSANGGPATGGTGTPAAPSALGGTTWTPAYYQLATFPFVRYDLSIVLPTTNPDYGELVAFNLYTDQIHGPAALERIDRPPGGWGFSPYIFTTEGLKQDVLAKTYNWEIRSVNTAGVETNPGLTGTVVVTAAGGPASPPAGSINMLSLGIAETLANRYRARDYTTHGILDLTVTNFIDYGNLDYTLYYSPDNGVTWYWTAVYTFSGFSAVIHIDKVCPLTNTNIKAWIVPGKYAGDPSAPTLVPSGGVVSSTFSFTGLQVATSTAVASATTGTVNAMIDPDGSQDWRIDGCTFTDASPIVDANARTSRVTVRIGKIVAGSFVAATAADGGLVKLNSQFDVDGSTHPVSGIVSWGWPADTTMDTCEITIEVLNGTGSATVQNCWSGGISASHGYVNFGNSIGKLKANRIDATTTDGSFVPKGATGLAGSGQPNNSTSLLRDFDFAISAFNGSVPLTPVWTSSILTTITSSGGPNNCAYASLTVGGVSSLTQAFTINPSQPLYCQVAVKGHGAGTLTLTVTFLDSSGSFAGSATIGSVIGGGWVINGIAGVLPAASIPATAVKGVFTLSTSFGSTTWDVTLLIVRQILQETSSGQTVTTVPNTYGGDVSALNAISQSTFASGFYGLDSISLFSPNGVNQFYATVSNSAVSVQASFGTGGSLESISLDVASGVSRVSLNRGGTISHGVDTTISGHTVLGGVVVT